MKNISAIVTAAILILAPAVLAGEQAPLKDQKARDSYALGYEFGANMKVRRVEIDPDVVLSGIRDAWEGRKAALESGEITETLNQLKKKVEVLSQLRLKEIGAKNLEEGKAFLEANARKEGVRTLPSGLQYKVMREGTGPVPKETDYVTVHYRGTFISGEEFDSSFSRGEAVTVPLDSVIPGWTEALKLMKCGSSWQVFVPPALAYGDRTYGRILPNSTLIFELELLEASAEEPVPAGAGFE